MPGVPSECLDTGDRHLRGPSLRGSKTLDFDPPGSSRDRRQSLSPLIRVAAVKPHRGAITADDHPVTVVMLDFVDPIGAGGVKP